MSHVFISHRSDDAQEAEQLAIDIQSANHNVWLDEWEIDLGDSIIARMNEGLEGATYVILCYSAHGNMSPWMGREWMSVLARQLNGVNVKIVPVLLSGGKPPAILADIKYADLSMDWEFGVTQILKAIK